VSYSCYYYSADFLHIPKCHFRHTNFRLISGSLLSSELRSYQGTQRRSCNFLWRRARLEIGLDGAASDAITQSRIYRRFWIHPDSCWYFIEVKKMFLIINSVLSTSQPYYLDLTYSAERWSYCDVKLWSVFNSGQHWLCRRSVDFALKTVTDKMLYLWLFRSKYSPTSRNAFLLFKLGHCCTGFTCRLRLCNKRK